MKLLAASILSIALISSPLVAQPDNTTAPDQKATTETTHVHTSTKHIHATNVPVQHHHGTAHHTGHHHGMHCSCPPTHMKGHHGKTHHTTKKSTETSTTKS